MTANVRPPRRILAVADTDGTQTALQTALSLATTHGASVEVIACVEPPHDLSILSRLSGKDPDRLIGDAVDQTRQAVRAQLDASAPDRTIDVTVAVGKTYLEIIRHVARADCDFVVKSAQPLSGMDRFLFASTDQHLLRKCPCPVWLQTPSARARPRRVLAAVDLDMADADEPGTLADLNRRVIATAGMIAGGSGADIVVLHVWDAIGEGMVWAFAGGRDARLSADRYVNAILDARRAAMEDFIAGLERDIGPGPRLVPRLTRGSPETVIRQECRRVGADVVVMGTVARTGLSGVFIGNTAENIINTLDCPVVAVKPEGFESPLLRG